MPTGEVLDQLAAAVVAGQVRVPITKAYNLDDIPRAIADFTAGTLRKLAVTIA
jgi:NADPH:quinone reductase-like Zn-dependent oxidoreductase